MLRGLLTLIIKLALAVCKASVTVMENGNEPPVAAVPEIIPVTEFRVTPAGRAPALTVKLGVPETDPGLKLICCEKAPFTTAFNGEVVVIAKTSRTRKVNALALFPVAS